MARPAWFPKPSDLPGMLLAVAIGAAAVLAVKAMPPSPLLSDQLVALLVGALLLNTPLGRLLGLRGGTKNRFGSGVAFTGKWILRLSIVLMGLKVQTSFFGKTAIATVFLVAAASIPSAFFVAHVLGVALRVRRPLVDLLAGGTMICGASAVNAIAPACGARRDDQGIAIAVVFLFSVTAMLSFRTIAFALGLDPVFAGLWSGLAVNDLSSAVAVGAQMGESGGVMAAASKSARILLLAPVLVSIALARRSRRAAKANLAKSIVDALPAFILGYVALAVVRAAGDRLLDGAAWWPQVIAGNRFVLDVLMSAVAAGIGLNLSLAVVLGSSIRAVGVGGGASIWMASLTVTMITLVARGGAAAATACGVAALALSAALHRWFASAPARARAITRRLDGGKSVTIEEAITLLAERERQSSLDDGFLRSLLPRIVPAPGELDDVRASRIEHGVGDRWLTFWEGASGWALVAVARAPGTTTPIHAHPHRMLGRAVEGRIEELRFRELEGGALELVSRAVVEGDALLDVDALATVHAVRVVSAELAIDLQLRGPEIGRPGRVLAPEGEADLGGLAVGARLIVREEPDTRPGRGGDGAAAGRPAASAT